MFWIMAAQDLGWFVIARRKELQHLFVIVLPRIYVIDSWHFLWVVIMSIVQCTKTLC